MTAKTDDKPKARKVLVLLTDSEWRELRIRAAAADTTIQGYLTTVLLGNLRQPRKGI